MLVVLAGREDPAARSLVARWSAAGHATRLMTCADLSRAGWQVDTGQPSAGQAIVDGQLTPLAELSGVLVRLPCVSEAEVPHIVADDRPFVASEMHAFLTYWLASLPCRVLNRPRLGGFGGPAWSTEMWVLRAAELGIPVRPMRRAARLGERATPSDRLWPTVSVVGRQCLGAPASAFEAYARRLAASTESDVLAVHFDERGQLVDADAWVDVWDDQVAEALLACLLEDAAC